MAKGIQRLETPERRRESKGGDSKKEDRGRGIGKLEPETGGIGTRETDSQEELQKDRNYVMADRSGGLGA